MKWSAAAKSATKAAAPLGAYRNLILATVALLLTSWAWGLISPLGTYYQQALGLSLLKQLILVAMPVLGGALGFIPVGLLADRYGARVILPAVTFLTAIPVISLSLVRSSYIGLLIVAFFLGIGGTPFAAAVPHAAEWFPSAKRGFVLGIVGAGLGGTAIAAVLTSPMRRHYDGNAQFFLVAFVLIVYGFVAGLLLRDPPGRTVPTTFFEQRLAEASRQRMTWPLAGVYAVTFGGCTAFTLYLVTYLQTAYRLAQPDVALVVAGFTLVLVLFRPLGGWVSDRTRPRTVLGVCLGALAVTALAQSFRPELAWAMISLLVMAAVLGAGSGAVFALLPRVTPKGQVGSVTGIVGAVGMLGGFVPPLVMGAGHSAIGSYGVGLLLLLALVVIGAFTYTLRIRPGEGSRQGAREQPVVVPATGSSAHEKRSVIGDTAGRIIGHDH